VKRSPIRRRTPLKATSALKRRTPLRGRPQPGQKASAAATEVVRDTPRPGSALTTKKRLRANPKRIVEAQRYHDAVFAAYGEQCVLCISRRPAEVAAHVIKRSELGRLRYADVRFARPAHDSCHRKQEAHEINFGSEIVASAIEAYNQLSRCKPKPDPVP